MSYSAENPFVVGDDGGPGTPKVKAKYSADNPFATTSHYSADNPFAGGAAPAEAPAEETPSALGGILRGAGNLAKGIVQFPADVVKSAASYTPEELRNADIRQYLTQQGEDPEAMLHEAIKRRAAGEPSGPLETALHVGKGLATMGSKMQEAIMPGPNAGNLVYDALTGKHSADEYIDQNGPELAAQFQRLSTPGGAAQAMTEYLGNAGMLAMGKAGEDAAAAKAARAKAAFDQHFPELPPDQPLANAARTMTDAELAQQPGGKTPPMEESNAAPGVQEQQVAELAKRMLGRRVADEPVALERRMGERRVGEGAVDVERRGAPHPDDYGNAAEYGLVADRRGPDLRLRVVPSPTLSPEDLAGNAAEYGLVADRKYGLVKDPSYTSPDAEDLLRGRGFPDEAVVGAEKPAGGILPDTQADYSNPQVAAAMARLKGTKALGQTVAVTAKEAGVVGNERGAVPLDLSRTTAAAVARDIQQAVAAPTVSSEAGAMAHIIRARNGQAARLGEIAAEHLKAFRPVVGGLSPVERLEFIDRIEAGKSQTRPELQPAADALRRVLDQARKEVQDLGTGKLESFIENYFPHIWEDPEAARDVFRDMMGKRPLSGPGSFLRQRTIPTVLDGINAGLKPVTDNPLDLALLKLREMRRYTMGQRVLADLKDQGLAQFVKASETMPKGFKLINDPIGTVYGRSAANELVIRGHYVTSEAAARVINNYLSPGLRGKALFDAYMALGNMMNQAQLGLSAFHLGFTSIDAVTSRVALGLLQVKSGRVLSGIKTFASAPIAPLTNYLLGGKVLKAYLAPGSQGPVLAAIVDGLSDGGGRVRMDSFYKSGAVKSFLDAVHEHRPVSALARALPAALELAAKPIMEHVVPRQKLGVFADLAKFELERLPAGATVDDVRAVMSKVWDSVDNRMGQLVYDNLFWNKTLKDLTMASVRSVGWNLGTVRELGGGLLDIVHGDFSHRAAYVVALPLTVGMLGAITQYLYTGSGPETLKDYFFPRTGHLDPDGNEERVQLPSYMKDVVGYGRHPIRTVQHKVHPLLGMITEMLENEDFYGDEIRNPNAPAVVQLQQEAQYLLKQFVPFGFRQSAEALKRGQPASVRNASFFGITPAHREDVRTPAQNLMSQFSAASGPQETTPEDAATRQIRQDIELGFRRNDPDAVEKLTSAVTSRQITIAQAQSIIQRITSPRTMLQFKQLTLDQAIQVWKKASPEERQQWMPLLMRKAQNAGKAGNVKSVQALVEELQRQE